MKPNHDLLHHQEPGLRRGLARKWRHQIRLGCRIIRSWVCSDQTPTPAGFPTGTWILTMSNFDRSCRQMNSVEDVYIAYSCSTIAIQNTIWWISSFPKSSPCCVETPMHLGFLSSFSSSVHQRWSRSVEGIIAMSRLPNHRSYTRRPMSTFPHSSHLSTLTLDEYSPTCWTAVCLPLHSDSASVLAQLCGEQYQALALWLRPRFLHALADHGGPRRTDYWLETTAGLLSSVVLAAPWCTRGNEFLYVCANMFCVLIVLTLSLPLCIQAWVISCLSVGPNVQPPSWVQFFPLLSKINTVPLRSNGYFSYILQ